MKAAIVQSCYIPWKGYFDIIADADVFVVYDDVQYRKNHWHNRNLIKTAQGTQWLTIPVNKSAGAFQLIQDIEVQHPFSEKHWRSIAQAYARAPHFSQYRDWLELCYSQMNSMNRLSEINFYLTKEICGQLDISTQFVKSSQLSASGIRSERLVAICKEVGASQYLSGPSAASYLDVQMFQDAGIDVKWVDYSGYPEYPQLHGGFEHAVSILDLLLNTGDEAPNFMKGKRSEK